VTDLLGDDAEHAPEDLREGLESVNRETDRLSSMIADLLDMSRIEGGMLRARLQGVDLAVVLAGCADRTRRRWPELALRTAVDDEAVVRADPVFLERVCANLLENAAKAALEAGAPGVEVIARMQDGKVVVAVADRGRGVPPSLRDQLFYPFHRMSERTPSLGTGLGLAICKGFLELMGGEIWVGETPGGGATFSFSLPAVGPVEPLREPGAVKP
jgi:two-component system sensor histidine kinase KdpD